MTNCLTKIKWVRLLLLNLMFLAVPPNGLACSGYKITKGHKTILGSNEDAWRVTPHIWFENTSGIGKYGAAFTGSRYDGANGYAPQSGMNTKGLAFERLASYHPKQQGFANRKTITNPTQYLKDILHRCATVAEVKAYISQFDHSYFIEDVFIYVDKFGNYLIVEPYTLTLGNEPTYVISNFCPSITPSENANKLDRYRNGVAYLKNKLDTSLDFCTALSDTMHVCREKIGDGTLLTSIWDLQDGKVNLYFYHNYKTTVQFDIKEELQKGDHSIAINTLFPTNPEFEKLRAYKIPKNCPAMGLIILGAAGLFLLTFLFFLFQFLRRKEHPSYGYMQVLMIPLSLIMCYYMYVLLFSINVYYFSAPYKDSTNVLVSLSSYIPFLMALLIIPLCTINYRLFKEMSWSFWAKALVTLNTMVYLILIGLFVYWGFYSVL
ncbi:hypothetical protein [Flavobacterium sp. 25HG05S-40]|uniref:hypothetical protein n=1 Tax=Flavobacterium sp. 25HG05S-40 TaxID=3458682 RepID=UPI0040441A58